MATVKWQTIVKDMPKSVKTNLCKRILNNYYWSLKGAINSDTDIVILHIGKLKANRMAKISEQAQKKYDHIEYKFRDKLAKRKRRMWVFEVIDKYWKPEWNEQTTKTHKKK